MTISLRFFYIYLLILPVLRSWEGPIGPLRVSPLLPLPSAPSDLPRLTHLRPGKVILLKKLVVQKKKKTVKNVINYDFWSIKLKPSCKHLHWFGLTATVAIF